MKVTLHQLDIFTEVVKQLSITKAARALKMTQPGVTIQIKELEKRYRINLVEIIGKKLYVTDAGKELYQTYQEITNKFSDIESAFSQRLGALKGNFKVCIVSTAQYFIPKLLGNFQKKYPDVQIKLTVTNRQMTLERLKNNEDDLVILSQKPKDLSIHSQAILVDQLVLIAAANHPLAKEKKRNIKELKNELFLVRESGSGTRMAMDKIFHKHQLQAKIIMELGSGEAIKQAVMANMGISLVSKMSIEQELKLKKLCILDIVEFPSKHTWYAVHLKQKHLTSIAKAFLAFVTDY